MIAKPARVGGGRCSDGLAGHPLEDVRVMTRLGNYSAFNGYRFTPSDYSCLRCRACDHVWRTRAEYVVHVRDGS